jgi:hypothetical protein
MPGSEIENVNGYIGSYLQSIFKAAKDTFYRFENCEYINWRDIQYKIAQQIKNRKDSVAWKLQAKEDESDEITCLVMDDSDTLKTGKSIEFISKIFSHVTGRCVLGQKTLTLAYWNKNSLIPLEFSKHGETNKNGDPLGMTVKQIKNRFSKKREQKSPGYKRAQQYKQDKISTGMEMLERAKKKGFSAQYVLFDSWFFCERILKKCVELGMKIVCMAKMGNAKYTWMGKEYTAQELLKIARSKKKITRCRTLKSHYAEFTVDYKGETIKLFLSKYTRKGSWNLLVTNDLHLNYLAAVKIYSKRWSIEVMFKELKQYLGFEKCQSTDFDAHIAHTTLCFIQYAILSHLKKIREYETIGLLFKDLKNENKILSIADKIWNLIMEILNVLSELLEFDLQELLTKIFKQDKMTSFLMKLAA